MIHYAKGFMHRNGVFFEAVITYRSLRLLRRITPQQAAAIDNTEFNSQLATARKLYGLKKGGIK